MKFPPPTPNQARLMWLALSGTAAAMLALLVIALVWGFGQALGALSPVLWPLAVAGVLAYLLDPVVDYIERRGAPRARAILSVFALAFVLAMALLSSVVPKAVVQARDLAANSGTYLGKIEAKFEYWATNSATFRLPEWFSSLPFLAPATNAPAATFPEVTNAVPRTSPELPSAATETSATNPPAAFATNAPAAIAPDGSATPPTSIWTQLLGTDAVKSASGQLARALPAIGNWFFGQVTRVASWFGVLAGLALIPVYLFYFLLEKRGIESRWTRYLPVSDSSFKDELVFVIGSINEYLIAFFRGQVLVALCDGVMYAVGFALIGLPYAVLIGVIASFLTIIPYLGAIVICGGALLISIVQFGDWLHPALVLGVFAIVQALEGLVIQPKIMGDRVGLHPLTIIVAVVAGTTLFGGLLGGLLAIPLTAALRVIMFRYVWKAPTPTPATPAAE